MGHASCDHNHEQYLRRSMFSFFLDDFDSPLGIFSGSDLAVECEGNKTLGAPITN